MYMLLGSISNSAKLLCTDYTRNKVPFYILPINFQQKHSKLRKYYDHDCLEKFYLSFGSLIKIQISQHSHILTQNTKPKQNMRNSAYKRLLNLKLLHNLFCLYVR